MPKRFDNALAGFAFPTMAAASILAMGLRLACAGGSPASKRDAAAASGKSAPPWRDPSCVVNTGCSPTTPYVACSPEVLAEPALTVEEAIREAGRLNGTVVHVRAPLNVDDWCTMAYCTLPHSSERVCCNECSGRTTLGADPWRKPAARIPLMGLGCKGDESGLCCPFGIIPGPIVFPIISPIVFRIFFPMICPKIASTF